MVITPLTNVFRLAHQVHLQTTKLKNVWQCAQKMKMFMVIPYFMCAHLLVQVDCLVVK